MVPKVEEVAVKAGGFIERHKKALIAVAPLLFAPLLTGDSDRFVLHAVGLGYGALPLRRFLMRRVARRPQHR